MQAALSPLNRLPTNCLSLPPLPHARSGVRVPFTGRVARLPPRLVELAWGALVGPAAAASYLATSAVAGAASGRADALLCRTAAPTLQELYGRLRAAGEAAATAAGGRPLTWAAPGPQSVQAIARSDVNAACLPGCGQRGARWLAGWLRLQLSY